MLVSRTGSVHNVGRNRIMVIDCSPIISRSLSVMSIRDNIVGVILVLAIHSIVCGMMMASYMCYHCQRDEH